jgi:hypothetical protein
VPEEYAKKYVFYHRQYAARLKADGGTMLAWSGDGHEIVKAFLEAGMVVKWDGSTNARIYVSHVPLKEEA